LLKDFDESEGSRILTKGSVEVERFWYKRFPVLGAYELALKCSHLFNLLDARGAISVTERVGVMTRIRTLVIGAAKMYVIQGARVSSNQRA
jgi:glycyl-tRNA synthetase alpha chain